jgi:Kef-type K+ transport system membrane component KefB
MTHRPLALLCFLCLLFHAASSYADAAGGHADPLATPLLALACVLLASKLGGHLAVRLGQASVLGELLAGVVLGNLDLFGISLFEWMGTDSVVDIFARLGVILLLFEVGLESTVGQMLKTGWSSLIVALVGVVTPFALGWGIGLLLVPEAGTYAHVFMGATLTATSVGITARVLKDLDHGQSPEARIILGAAVIDDVLGLVILAVVTGVIAAASSGQTLSAFEISKTLLWSLGFLGGSLVLGVWLSPRAFRIASRLRSPGVLLACALSFCFALSWAANAIGLAPIVGAFAAGLILEHAHYTDFSSRGERELEELVQPLTSFLVPIFFVVMGIRTDLRAFAAEGVLLLALALTVAAIVGKLACAFAVTGGVADRLSVGIGMIPRGEVGLIFANIGIGLMMGSHAIVSQHEFSAIVVMVIITTMITPPLLKWSLLRAARRQAAAALGSGSA